jgi:hypothetical protein
MIIEDWVSYTLTDDELEQLLDKQDQQHDKELQLVEERIEKLEANNGTRCWGLPVL